MAVRMIVALGLASGMALSWKLWYTAERAFPMLPVSFMPGFPGWVEPLVLGCLAISLISMFLTHGWHRFFTAAVVGLIGVLAANDQMRLQPWVYQYWLLLIPLILLKQAKGSEVSSSTELILNTQRMIMIAVYFWAGFHKFNPAFEAVWIESVVEPLLGYLDGTLCRHSP